MSDALLHGLNTHQGKLTYQAVAESFGMTFTDPLAALG